MVLKPAVWSLNSVGSSAHEGRAPMVRMSPQDRGDSHPGQGLGRSLGLDVPPANRYRHSSYTGHTGQIKQITSW